ncbi:translocation/assembly module TamB domain-containing protein [Lichenicoccus sp.]|uniref:translocation/assembly module TamB domain-containing protein n=1 Tax=Lichenicoccus sp. TaxID=2781899 RepID=UPI003D122A9F
MADANPASGRRLRRIVLWLAGLLVAAPLALIALALAVLLVGANTGPGRRLIEQQAASLSGGLVTLTGLGGRFPDELRVAHVEVHDHLGTWLTLDGIRLDWHPLALLGRSARIDLASIDRIAVARKPVPDPNAKPAPPAKSGGSSVPNFAIDLRALHVGALEVAAPVTGFAADVGIDGHVQVAGIAPLLSGVSVATLPDSDIALDVRRLDHPGAVSLTTVTTADRLGLHLRADDPQGGMVAALAALPMLDPLTLSLDLDGPRNASAVDLALHAGPVTLAARGTADLLTRHFDLRTTGRAPAMAPRPGIAWNGLSLDAHVSGTPTAPAGSGRLVLDNLTAPRVGLSRLTADFTGEAPNAEKGGGAAIGPATLHAVLDGLRIPGPRPALLAQSPVILDATLHDEQPGRPVDLTIFHDLAQIRGRVFLAPALHGHLGITLPQLAPLAEMGGVALDGHAAIGADFEQRAGAEILGLGGTVAITGGQPQAVGLIGQAGRIALTASLAGQTVRVYGLTVDGSALHLDASGSDLASILDLHASLRLPDLQAALPTLRGTLGLQAGVHGPLDDLAASVRADGDVGSNIIPQGPLRLALDATHLPKAPEGRITLDGTLDSAPLTLAANVARSAAGATHVTLDRLGWKSATGRADMTLPAGARLPLGTLDIRMTRLADLSRIAGQAISGSLKALIQTQQPPGQPHPVARVDLSGSLGAKAAHVGQLALRGTVVDPAGSPDIDLALRADQIAASGITGHARMTAKGPQTALGVVLGGAFEHVAGAPASIDTALILDLPGKHVQVTRLAATAKGEALRLLGPARIGFGAPIAVDHLRASLAAAGGMGAPALLDIAGQVSPRLDLTASLANVTPALAKPFAPSLDATGVIALQARLTGSTARPSGTVTLTARNLHLRTGPGASLPPGTLDARAVLAAGAARIAARLDAGRQIALALDGTAPVSAAGALGLRARGNIDLAVANAVLGAEGRQAGGELALDLGVSGTVQAPRLDGTIRLDHGQIQDFAQGVRLTDIAALIAARGQSISIERFVAHAGDGTLEASGTVGALLPGLPVDLHLTAHHARPLASDLLTAVLDMDITAKGQAQSRLDIAGTVTIDSASINIPNSLPASVATLDVIRPGETPPPPASAAGSRVIGLDMAVNSPGQIFVRGHGLDAEMAGRLHVGGTTTAPQVSGGFDMRRGTFSLAGVTLTFTRGRVGFNGAGVTNAIDPSLDFTAESFVDADVAKLNIGGYASAPKITLSSNPPLPQDQVLALILFQQTTTKLSTTQLASLAAALAELSGGGSGGGVLDTVRGTLGLDRLSIGSGGANTSGASVEAGKYVAKGVYVGARQATSGSGTQAQVQIDLTRRLKLDTVVGTGGQVTGTTTPENDPGSSVGLKYQFQY